MTKRTVLHVDGKTKVLAKGMVINGEFVGEYKFQGMTYGVSLSLCELIKSGVLNKVLANNSFRNITKGIMYNIEKVEYADDDFVCEKGDMIINGLHYSNFDII